MSTPLQRSVNQEQAGGWGGESNITRSAWFDGSADHLDRTPSSASTDRTRQIWGCWIRRIDFSAAARGIFGAGTGASARAMLFLSTSKFYWELSGGITATSVAVFRDHEWMHFVASYDGNESTNADKLKVYFNGEEIELTFAGTLPTTPQHFGDAILHTIGSNTSVGNVMYGSLAQAFHIADKSIQNGDHAITDLGESVTAGTNGVIWAPRSDADIKTLVDAGGGNSFLISSAFGDGTDDSANGNNFTPTSMSDLTNGSDDTPSSPLPIFNPLHNSAVTTTISEGGARANLATGAGWLSVNILVPPTGKWYVEFLANSVSNSNMAVGVCNPASEQDATPRASGFLHWEADGDRYLDGSQTATEVTGWSATDVIGLGINMDDQQLLFYDNAGNLDATVAFGSNVDGTNGVLLYLGNLSGSGAQNATLIINSADMTHGLPTDYSELKHSNFEAPTVQGADLFNALPYTGDNTAIGSGGQSQTGVGFQPDFVWAKGRNTGSDHRWTDSSRGVTKALQSSTLDAEITESEGLTAFDADGFTHGNSGGWGAAFNYVAWCWKLNGGTTVTNNDGDIQSTVQLANNGFMSIVQWTGNATVDQDIGHGLGSSDLTIITKNRTDNSTNWAITFVGFTNTQYFEFDTDAVGTPGPTYYKRDDFTTTTFRVNSDNRTNGSGDNMVAFCFKNLPGVCATGYYVGNGSADGPFIATGMRCRWLMIKGDVSPQEWLLYDVARAPFNDDATLYLEHDAGTEGTSGVKSVDFLANGFKIRDTSATFNSSGVDYYYIAIADVASGSGLPPTPGR